MIVEIRSVPCDGYSVEPVGQAARKAYQAHMVEMLGHSDCCGWLCDERLKGLGLSATALEALKRLGRCRIRMSRYEFGCILGYDAHEVAW